MPAHCYPDVWQAFHARPETLDCSQRNYPQWHKGRPYYYFIGLLLDDEPQQQLMACCRQNLADLLLQPYTRQPHLTIYPCGFLTPQAHHNDDITTDDIARLYRRIQALALPSLQLQSHAVNSFAEAPFIEISSGGNALGRLCTQLRQFRSDFRQTPFTPHLTIGMYRKAWPVADVIPRLQQLPVQPLAWQTQNLQLLRYRADDTGSAIELCETIPLRG